MDGKFLGKIISAEFGTIKDYPFFIGIQLEFSFDGSVCSCISKYTVNIHKECKQTEEEKAIACMNSIEKVSEILKSAKCNYVSELVGKPVEVTIERNTFKEFRILTEVL